MSANETFDGYYADTAYTPDQRRNWEEENPEREKIFGSRLSWDRKTRDTGTKDEYGFNNLAIADNWETRRAEKRVDGEDAFRALKVRYDYQSIMPPNFRALSYFIYMATAIGKGGGYMFLVAAFSAVVLSFFYFLFSDMGFLEIFDGVLYFLGVLTPIFVIFVVVWMVGEYLKKNRPDIFLGMKSTPLWQANRQTGLFTIYHPKKAWKKKLEAPFYEFDIFLQSSPDTQGSSTYSLVLYHSKSGIKQPLKAQFPASKMRGDLMAAWQFLQRYMDISQPLPDVPGLEIHRHKDPTTAKADKRRRRNPRFWRDKTEDEIKKIQEDQYRKNIRLR